MQKKHHHNTIRIKVIGWFLLAAMAVLLTGVISYNSYRQLLGSLNQNATQETKLKTLGDILANITKAEANMRAYGLTRDPKLLQDYQQLVMVINDELQRVKNIPPVDHAFNANIDSISNMLRQQTAGVGGFIELKSAFDDVSFSSKALEEISSSADSIPALTTTTTTTTTTTRVDPVIQEQEANGKKNTKRQQRKRAQQIAKALAQLEEKPQIQTETTVVTDSSYVPPDSLLGNIQQILADIGAQEDQYQQLVAEKELLLIESSILIIDQIRGLIGALEKQELALNFEQASNAKLIASRSTLTISIIIFVLLIIGILFTYWIFRDVRISDFYNKQLIGAKNQAEQLADSKQQFLANMSHEIRTPLNAIIGFTEQLAGTELLPNQRQYLGAVQTSSQHLLDTVNDILDFSKIEAGELKIHKTPFELSAVLQDVVGTLQLKAREKELELSLTLLPETPIHLIGDPFRLKQILFNLISNGIKFTEEGYVKIHCEYTTLEDGIKLQLLVLDSGIGIPEAKRDEIFKDFKQVDPTATRRYQGTGLGLAICKRLAEMQGGIIKVRPNEPHGSIFELQLDYPIAPNPQTQTQTHTPTHTQTQTQTVLSGLRVLVADDDAFNIQLIRTMMDKWEVDAVYCSNGKEALKQLENNTFQLILTDINMPEMGGMELSQYVRAMEHPVKSQTPIIALTANVIENDIIKYRESGINDIILKPFNESSLFEKIKQIIGGAEQPYKLDDLKRFSAGDQQALRPMLEAFHHNLEQNMKALMAYAHDQNQQKVAELAHKMISSFGHVYASEPVKKLRELENAIKTQSMNKPIQELVEEVSKVSQPVLSGLNQEIEILDKV
jgi:signal transduction histidine kinase/DNA-binding response OmpR family regulator